MLCDSNLARTIFDSASHLSSHCLSIGLNMFHFETILVALGLFGFSVGQMMILEFRPSDSNITTRYYVVNLDRSKALGERCLENDECQSGECYLRLCTFSTFLNHSQSVQLLSLIGDFLNCE